MRVGKRKKAGAKKVEMPQVEFNLKAIREIKKRNKRSKQGRKPKKLHENR
jgi:hypothetical protein